jgi:2,3,4,5-tetrahydropyridine-2-carboxylate N-succinyltransferase
MSTSSTPDNISFTSNISSLRQIISEAFANPALLNEKTTQNAVYQVLRGLEKGSLRVASPAHLGPDCGQVPMEGDLRTWQVHTWVKEAILLAMKLRTAQGRYVPLSSSENQNTHDISQERIHGNTWATFDKFDMQNNLGQNQVRVVPGALPREGAYLAPGVILMPSFVNIGAFIGKNTMIDTWATAGSCAQIGSHVHVAGGVGIGGVLEPANARPVIVGDEAFLGSRAILVEGVVVGSRAVIGANVCLTASTPIYDVTTPSKTEFRGYVPPHAVVAPGTRSKSFPGGEVSLGCAYIIAYRSERTDAKVSLNDILRETGIAT